MAVVFRNSNLFCDHCGEEHKLSFPAQVDEITKKTKLFTDLHKDCKKTWTQPEPDFKDDEDKRAKWWWSHCSRGMSSEAMWHCFMKTGKGASHHPHDPDDFSRCYGLLKVVPEWKQRLHLLESLSPQWKSLVANWDKLTEMYEENVKNDWITCDQIGMFDFMEKILKKA